MNTARLHIDLQRFRRNLETVRQALGPCELGFVVKDDAYGHGLAPLVSTADKEGVRWYGALDAETGAQVRETVGAHTRILVWLLTGPDDIAHAMAADLDLGIGSLELLDEVAAAGGTPHVHLKVDTGLHRNGFLLSQWADACARAADYERRGVLRVVGLWSHIAEASSEKDDQARGEFERASAIARAAGLTPGIRHLAASAAALARPEFRYDMARVGAFCYGIRSAGEPALPDIEPIATLEAPVIAVEDTRVTVGIGALDGLTSRARNLLPVSTVDGQRMIRDVGEVTTDIEPWPHARVGQFVSLWGRRAAWTATDLADALGTVGEEVVLRVAPGLARTYE